MAKIAIIGTGLIGTSLALALNDSQLKDLQVVGTDADRSVRNRAEKRKAFHKVENQLLSAIDGADIVVLATPVMTMKEIMKLIASELPPGCVVTDVGSSKKVVLEWAQEILPDTVDFIGGHPMAGKEESGPDSAESGLFQDKTYCVIPGMNASQQSVSEITTMVEAIGAVPYFIGVDEHDSFVAAASHLPFLLSTSLVACTSKSPNWEDIAQLASSGYRDITRLASGDTVMHRDICLTNNQPIISWIDAFIKELYEFRNILADESGPDSDKVKKVFDDVAGARAQWLAGEATVKARLANRQREEMPTFSESMGEMFMGRKLLQANKRIFGGLKGQDRDNK
ncbi:MAG: prephenate dehydrogenase/arogenate dehydrogenase family protein [Chloroflexota bacterium]|nr:prephenate dehydrogenase/arogenate dehydrogenase family protein [Chloroflexota bacterium]